MTLIIPVVVLGHRSLTILTRVLYATQRCRSSGLVRPPAQDPRPTTYQPTDAVVVNQSRYDLHTLRCRNAVCGAGRFLALRCRAASAHAHRAHRARHAPDAHRDRARFHLMCLHQSCWRDTPEWGQLERWAQAARALRGENAARRARGGGLRCYALMQRAPRP